MSEALKHSEAASPMRNRKIVRSLTVAVTLGLVFMGVNPILDAFATTTDYGEDLTATNAGGIQLLEAAGGLGAAYDGSGKIVIFGGEISSESATSDQLRHQRLSPCYGGYILPGINDLPHDPTGMGHEETCDNYWVHSNNSVELPQQEVPFLNEYVDYGERWTVFTDGIYILDTATETISDSGNTLPTPRGWFGYATVGSTAYVFGGYQNDGNGDYGVVDDILAIDLTTGAVTDTGFDLPVAAHSIAAVTVGTDIYLFGGKAEEGMMYNDDPAGYTVEYLNTTHKFTPGTGLTQLADIDSRGIMGMSGVYDSGADKVYLFGGKYHGERAITNEIHIFDVAAGTASSVDPTRATPHPIFGTDVATNVTHSSAFYNDHLNLPQFVGGYGATIERDGNQYRESDARSFEEFARYAPGANTLSTDEGVLQDAAYGTAAVYDGDYAWVFGGKPDHGSYSDQIVKFQSGLFDFSVGLESGPATDFYNNLYPYHPLNGTDQYTFTFNITFFGSEDDVISWELEDDNGWLVPQTGSTATLTDGVSELVEVVIDTPAHGATTMTFTATSGNDDDLVRTVNLELMIPIDIVNHFDQRSAAFPMFDPVGGKVVLRYKENSTYNGQADPENNHGYVGAGIPVEVREERGGQNGGFRNDTLGFDTDGFNVSASHSVVTFTDEGGRAEFNLGNPFVRTTAALSQAPGTHYLTIRVLDDSYLEQVCYSYNYARGTCVNSGPLFAFSDYATIANYYVYAPVDAYTP